MITLIMKTYFYLSRKDINAKGLCPILCRIANGPDRANFSTGIYIAEKDWNAKNGMPQKKLIREYNALQRLQAELIPFIFTCENSGIVSTMQILNLYREKKQPKIHYIVEVANEYCKEKISNVITFKRYRCLISDLDCFFSKLDIAKIEANKVNAFSIYLSSKGLKTSVIKRKMACFKNILSYAEQKEYIRKSPFYFYKPLKAENKKPVSITQKELTELESIICEPRLDNVRRLFLLQCYTGLSYIDLSKFDQSNVIEVNGIKFYKGNREKTGSEFYFPFTEKIENIFASCNMISNQKYNQYLKELGEKIGTEKKLTTHVGRRTFAQLNINNGLSFEAVAVMMGHSSTRMTEKHYSRAGIERLTNELKGFKAA